QAERAGARITLTLGARTSTPLQGSIESATAESLWIEIEQPEVTLGPELQSVCCDGVIELEATRFLLTSNVLAVVTESGASRVEIARPDGLQVVQRRHFWRATVQDSSPVVLSRPGAEDEACWSCAASMMNLSVAGLACLAERSAADATEVGEQVRIMFRVRRSDEPFVVDSMLRSKTPAGTDGMIILGFEFNLAGDPQQQQRLHTALEHLA
ncbi:MAG: PilZ domain-containing protein, partial [Planctomycetota bacterium]